MPVSEKVSFFSRFSQKFVEVVGAGVATAVTGYLIAHVSGVWSAQTPSPTAAPASVQVIAPTATVVVSKAPRGQPSQPVQPNQSTSADAGEQRSAPAQDVAPPAAQPARTIVNASQTAPARKRAVTESTATESKPRERANAEASATESKPRDSERDMEAVEAQVRAALANVDASHPPPAEPPRQAEAKPAATAVQPKLADIPPPAAVAPAAPPNVSAAAPSSVSATVAPQQQPAVPAAPLGTVEIKSRPVADIASTPDLAAAEDSSQGKQEDKGLFAALKKIPDMLRPNPPPAADPPRPPLPVGDSQ